MAYKYVHVTYENLHKQLGNNLYRTDWLLVTSEHQRIPEGEAWVVHRPLTVLSIAKAHIHAPDEKVVDLENADVLCKVKDTPQGLKTVIGVIVLAFG